MVKKIIIAIIAIIIIAIIGVSVWYNSGISAVNQNDLDKINVEIEMGSGPAKIGKQLKDNGLIKDITVFKIYVKLNNIKNFQAGNYQLSKSMNLKEITEILQTGKIGSQNEITITFVEGKNMRWVAKKIAEETNNTENDVFELLKNEEYIDSLIDKYWFITDEVKNSDIYYSLEGYLFPDTYQFEDKDVSVDKIFETLLNQMEKKLESYKDSINQSEYSIHELFTLASIIENEGRSNEDKKSISSVLYNRLKKGMSLGCDATTYYAFKIELGSRDLYKSELNKYNPYNTRGPEMEGKIPVGPICMSGKASIEAAIFPDTTEYLYYVTDNKGKAYFTKTNAEHEAKIKELKANNAWAQF